MNHFFIPLQYEHPFHYLTSQVSSIFWMHTKAMTQVLVEYQNAKFQSTKTLEMYF